MLTPAGTESTLMRVAKKLEQQTDELPKLLQAAAENDVAYRAAFARALLTSDAKTVAEREAEATLATTELLFQRKTSEAVADAAKESVRSLRDLLSAAQTLNRSVTESMKG